jgi:integrase
MRRFPIGSYPGKGISEARSDARALHTRVKHEGADPVAERRRERAINDAAKAGIGTLTAVLDTYGEKRGNQQRAWPESRKRINLVFKGLLGRPVTTLTLADLQLAADNYAFPKSAAFAVRTLRPALKWAAQPGRKYVPAELANLSTSETVERRKRVLTRDELARLLPILRSSSRPYAAALRFMLMTLARRQEAALARWRDVNLEARTWTIPETKNGEPHVVPLSRQAIDLLRSRCPSDNAGNPYPGPNAPVFATSSGAPLGDWDRETKVLQQASGTEGWTRHDLRRTGATMLGEMGELPDIIEAALNHVSIRSPLAATYNRSRYRPQVATALQRLADALDGIQAGAATVVPLRAQN